MGTDVDSELTYAIIGAAMEVHTIMRRGYLEPIYQRSMECELRLRGIPFVPQANLKVYYKGDLVGDYFADLLVDNRIIVELKALSQLVPDHHAQVLN